LLAAHGRHNLDLPLEVTGTGRDIVASTY